MYSRLHNAGSLVALSVVGLIAVLLIASAAVPAMATQRSSSAATPATVIVATSPLQITTFQYSPSTVTQGTSTQVSIQLAGGTPPFYAWLNGTPPGCSSQSVPVVTSNYSNNFQCTPTGTGNFVVDLTVLDSSSPTQKISQSASLTVNSNNNNGNGGNNNNNNGGNGSGSSGLNLPTGFLSLLMIFAIVVLAALVATAAGTIATAVAVSRRLRQVNETLKAMQLPPQGPKPPT